MTAKTPEQIKTAIAFTHLLNKIELLNQCVNECEGSELERECERIVYGICDDMDELIRTINGRKFKMSVIKDFKAAYAKFDKKIKTLIDFTFGTEGSERQEGIGKYARSVKRAVPAFKQSLNDCEIM